MEKGIETQRHYHELLYREPFIYLEYGDLPARNDKAWNIQGGTLQFSADTLILKGGEEGIFSTTFQTTNIGDKTLQLSIPDVQGTAELYMALNYGQSKKVLTFNSSGKYKINLGEHVPHNAEVNIPAGVDHIYDTYAIYKVDTPSLKKVARKFVHGPVIVSLMFQLTPGSELHIDYIKLLK
jgi:hypothetical protein